MNDSLNRWLTNHGFPTGSLNDKIKAYLVAQTAGTGLETVNDLWITMGTLNGYGIEILEIQRNWAIAQGSSSTLTWNDAMGTLPP